MTMEKAVDMPADVIPMNVMPGALRRRWEELTARSNPSTELAFIHEASERGDNLLKRYFGKSVVQIDGRRVRAHHAIMTMNLVENDPTRSSAGQFAVMHNTTVLDFFGGGVLGAGGSPV